MTRAPTPLAFAGGRYDSRPPRPRLFFDPALLAAPLSALPGVGSVLTRRLSGLGLVTVGELVEHYPRRYEDFTQRKRIAEVKLGEEATVRGAVERVRAERTARRNVRVTRVTLRDESGVLEAVWFNQPYLADVFAEGMQLSLRGTYKPQARRPTFIVKAHEILAEKGETVHTEGIVPVYPASEEVSARFLRTLVHLVTPVMRLLPDPLPAELRARERLPSKAAAVLAAHVPTTLAEARAARERLVLEELLLMQLGLLIHKRHEEASARALALPAPGPLATGFVADLPFALTPYQEHAIDEIEGDLVRVVPMRRLLQGDVGSGKTVVALYTLLRAVEAGTQGAFMAPTETLAEQHFDTIKALGGGRARVELLTSRLTAAERRDTLARIAAGETDVVVGTHALIQGDVAFADLAVVVVDEQHRFGVAQRDELAARATDDGRSPHLLYMTATPIPRTLALTFYGDLDVTTIEGSPAGRTPVVTRLVGEEKRPRGYDFMRKQLDKGRQAYVVCPNIEESESLQTAAALEEAERLRCTEFRDYRVEVVHGQLKTAERERVMAAFKGGAIHVLVATTVIEVGIDVPNATVMMIESAERFGLAQLHQLRGRVGRGAHKSYCLLFAETTTRNADARLKAMLETNDGFVLADRDLEIRGEGQLFGTRQSGLPDLKIAKLTRDRETVIRARRLARAILDSDPELEHPRHGPLSDALHEAFGGEVAWLLKA
ncbi:MAG TPA: ATP-dependent DNA helicase RecG [Thermoleophilia bacterium]|nr:ATP-dependent DNA helicase RecG [Thermoleophilia bacterium]